MSDSTDLLPSCAEHKITGIILAGGQASRMGYQDKGLIELAGKPLVSWVKQAMEGVATDVYISCNRHFNQYQQITRQLVKDAEPNQYEGPLAGILATAKQVDTPWLLCVPTDTPLITASLLVTWINEVNLTANPTSYLQTEKQGHFLHCLVKRADALRIEQQLQQGNRKVFDWLTGIEAKPWQVPALFHSQLMNINTPQELTAAGELLKKNTSISVK
ncbi:molybdenum cofactor guanylyltransferase [Endozoicomonas sp. SM1973]|uniref:Molybdenum cofactor guanylyltransferase n=1 Tax=Spartinivicinus marinus TaxID=2994442 RepID=A0A853HSX2_9GAMM|nr:molybdenum cofactor guanylyltransferase [Spartinivicinus marinus]MCX4029877.1 molybdenum cofactor guanylyltransferase [Spartinivicinus marinus]NYZ64880.1 molybdenum cofactor guanylyltransferase [Spartinivicinus marinus]